MSDDEGHVEQPEVDEDEGRRRMEEARVNRQEKQHQEIAEYEEMRRDQRDKEAEDIKALRERRELRKLERKGEEKRLTELMIQEEARRKAEEEERKRKKNEEERERRETLELKRREAEERLKPKRPNYVIQKKEGATDEPVVPKTFSGDEYQKSKEQMEEEKRAILVQRISELNISNLQTAQLIEKAKELFEHIRKLTGDKYDCDQQFKRQQYDMIELQERARQMNKGKKGVSVVQVDETFNRLADKHTGAPPKIQLCSKYERHTDHRTYGQRTELFEEMLKEVPPPEITRIHSKAEAGEEEAEAGDE